MIPTPSVAPTASVRPTARPRHWAQRPRRRPRSIFPIGSLRPLALSIRPLASFAPIRIVVADESLPLRRVAIPRWAIVGALVVGLGFLGYAAALPRAPNAPRTLTPIVMSGTAGLKTTAGGAHERWGSRPVTLTFDASLDDISPNAKEAVKAAFGEWVSSDGSLPPLGFDSSKARGKLAQDGKNLILFGPITIKGHEHDVAVTVSYIDATSGEIVEADTIFNSSYAFGVLDQAAMNSRGGEGNDDGNRARACEGKYDLQNVATHEAGHFFGLGEDVEDAKATMYLRSSTCETHKRVLTDPDRTVMASLYAEPSPAPVIAPASAKGCSK